MTVTNHHTLDGCLPALVRAYNELYYLAAQAGITIGIADYGGLRDEATTAQLIAWRDEAVAQGGEDAYYPVAPYGESKHDYGGAFDVKIFAATVPDALDRVGALAPQCGLTWGGTWPGKAQDRPHFELELTLDELRKDFTTDDNA
jgi:hypothetical protein